MNKIIDKNDSIMKELIKSSVRLSDSLEKSQLTFPIMTRIDSIQTDMKNLMHSVDELNKELSNKNVSASPSHQERMNEDNLTKEVLAVFKPLILLYIMNKK